MLSSSVRCSRQLDDGGAKYIALILIAIMILVTTIAIAPSIHATMKHGTDAEIARTCLSQKGATTFVNPKTNRFGVVCETDGVWGVVILDSAKREITAFVKNKMRGFDQVLQYMRNAGYEIVH